MHKVELFSGKKLSRTFPIVLLLFGSFSSCVQPKLDPAEYRGTFHLTVSSSSVGSLEVGRVRYSRPILLSFDKLGVPSINGVVVEGGASFAIPIIGGGVMLRITGVQITGGCILATLQMECKDSLGRRMLGTGTLTLRQSGSPRIRLFLRCDNSKKQMLLFGESK